MHVELSPDQEELRRSLRGLVERHAPLTVVRERYGQPAGPPDLWDALVELGLPAILVPASLGGLDLGMVDLGLALEELGRALYHGPARSSALAATALVRLAADDEARDRLLPGLAGGSVIGTVVPASAGVHHDGTRLVGEAAWVPEIAVATSAFVVAHHAAAEPRGLGLYEVAADDLDVTPQECVDGTQAFARVAFLGPGRRIDGGDTSATAAAARGVEDLATIGIVLDAVGAADRALELAVAYAQDRQQFGKPIGSFQAVQHLCADMLRDVELARVAGYYALWTADEWLAGRDDDGAELHRAATMAKAWSSDALLRVGASTIQVFGGIGFTWDCDAHLFYKRLLVAEQLQGDADVHLAELADLLLPAAQ